MTPAEETEIKQQVPLLACSPRGTSLFLIWGQGRDKSRSLAREVTGSLPTPLLVVFAGGTLSTLLLLPTPYFFSQIFRNGNWVFLLLFVCLFVLYLLSIICSNCTCTRLFLVPCSFSVFCCWRRGLSRSKHCSKGSQVPTCLISSQVDPELGRGRTYFSVSNINVDYVS